ncbi:hypothetical protein cypCar_00032546 [Cyprinus carpio]|nr:hypothetical protein cypCar_00032546 [Cyprinus carpio]
MLHLILPAQDPEKVLSKHRYPNSKNLTAYITPSGQKAVRGGGLVPWRKMAKKSCSRQISSLLLVHKSCIDHEVHNMGRYKWLSLSHISHTGGSCLLESLVFLPELHFHENREAVLN